MTYIQSVLDRASNEWTEHATTKFAEEVRCSDYARFFPALLEFGRVSPRSRIVDLGCGAGVSTEMIYKHLKPRELIAVDPSAPALGVAQKRLGTKVTYIQAAAENLGEVVSNVDVVVTGFAFVYFEDHNEALNQIKKALKKDGVFLTHIALRVGDWTLERISNALGYNPSHVGKDFDQIAIERLFERDRFRVRRSKEWDNIKIEGELVMKEMFYVLAPR